jgi:uncharacterized membrane protein
VARLGFEPVYGSFLLAVLAIGLLAALLAVLPRYRRLTHRQHATLVVLRAGAVLVAALLLVRPVWVTTIRIPRPSVLLILADQSRSMLLPSGRSEQSRWQAQKTALAQVEEVLAGLQRQAELRVYGYDDRLHPLEVTAGRIQWPDQPTGRQTDIGGALDAALQAQQGKRLAGVLLLGDGAQTAYEPAVEVQQAARRVRDEFAAPLYTVTFGLAQDAAQGRDVAVERMDEQFTVFVKNELVVRAVVRARGFVRQEIPLTLWLSGSGQPREAVARRTIRPELDDQLLEVELSYTPQTPGQYRLSLEIEPQPQEQVTLNNQLEAFLTVLEGGLKVLYLDGSARYEQKFLRRAINASPDIELDDRVLDARVARQGPPDLKADFQKQAYDAYILGDLDAQVLGLENLRALAEAVGRGKGLLMIGGLASFGRGHYVGTPLEDVLPITIDPLEASVGEGPTADRFFLPGPLPLVPTGRHPITQLAADEAENRQLWSRLPPLDWAHRFTAPKAAPGVKVLLQTPAGQPILVAGEYGAGRTLAFAGESTYRWPLHGFTREHQRFWRQVVLWLVGREELARDEVWVKLDQRRLFPGGRLGISAGVRLAQQPPGTSAQLRATLVQPDGRRESVPLVLQNDLFRGLAQPSQPGDYAIEVQAVLGEQPLGTARAEFVVYDRDVELSTPAADPDLMASLAAWTAQEGGRALAPEDLAAVLKKLGQRAMEYEVRQTRWKLGATAWDAWLVLLLLAALLTSEWFLRKRWGLV